MAKETEFNNQYEFFDGPYSLEALVTDKELLEELSNFRKRGSAKDDPFSDKLRECLDLVYFTFEPVAIRLVEKRMRLFSGINNETKEDIQMHQCGRLWEFIVKDFHWENFTDGRAATGAFMNYLEKATGSFFASEVIGNQNLSGFKINRKRKIPLERSIEDDLIQKEVPLSIAAAWNKWKADTSDIYVKAVERKYLEGISLKEQAKNEKVQIDAMKKRLNIGKKELFKTLVEDEIMLPDDVLSGKLLLGKGSRKELLDSRRTKLKNSLPAWEGILNKKPKLRNALNAFYGLDGNDFALYDYAKTAEATGLTLATARVFISEGTRLLLGVVKPSQSSQNGGQDSDLFQYWLNHKESLQFSDQESAILEMYFEEKYRYTDIAQKMGISEETARRRKIHALKLVQLVMNGNTKN